MLARTAPLSIAILVLVLPTASADCPPDPPPPTCDVDGQFLGGRWDISTLSGTYDVSGTEVYDPWFDPMYVDEFDVSGTLTVEMLGGPEQNYLDVACDGTVTGQGRERISGTIVKEHVEYACDPPFGGVGPGPSSLNVTFERSYTITGQVSGTGELELELTVDTAQFSVDGNARYHGDCVFTDDPVNIGPVDVSGDAENVRLSGGYDPGSYTFAPTVTPLDPVAWVEDISHRLQVEATFPNPDPVLLPPDTPQPSGADLFFTYMLLQDAVTMISDVSAQSDARTPVVTALDLQEPSYYLTGVDIDTEVVATVDWRASDGTQEVEFTYGGTVETVPGGSGTVTWTFNAGEPATQVEAVARAGDEESQPYVVNTPKVAVPGWAGSASDWSGASGISYAATLDWPVSLETTRTLSTISLLSGLWGISGSASSELNVNAASSGAQVAGDLATSANLNLAGNTYSLEMSGDNQTELSCEDLTTTGNATAQLPSARWQKTLNPVTAIPGVSTAACSLHRILCELVNGVGITASAEVGLSGTAGFTGEGDEILWDSGGLQGDIGAKVRASAVPPPLDSLAALSVEGGGSGCIGFQFVPDVFLDTLGGEVHVAATLAFFGFSANPSHEWPFGDSCGAKTTAVGGGDPGWVPADGQLTMAVRPDLAAAVWTELPVGQSRPSGDIRLRLWDGSSWGAEVALNDDVASDLAPAAAFDETGRLVVVYQRNVQPLPTDLSQVDAYGDGYELHWAAVDPATAQVVDAGALTANAANDFGPFLRAGADGTLHLFWQRADGAELVGTDVRPVSVVTRSLVGGQWTAEEVAAADLEGVFGWSPAARSDDEMLIGLIRDTDGDLGTDEDRELFVITRTVGAWDLPVRVTSDLLVDDSPQAAYDESGEPVLLWRSDGEVLQLRGDLTAAPQPAFGSADPATDGGIGGQLALGRLAGGPSGLAVIWPEGAQLELATDPSGGMPGGWSSPTRPFPGPDAQSVHGLDATDTALTVGYATRAFTTDGTSLEPTITPRVGEISFATIFADGFQSGDLSAWSAAVP